MMVKLVKKLSFCGPVDLFIYLETKISYLRVQLSYTNSVFVEETIRERLRLSVVMEGKEHRYTGVKSSRLLQHITPKQIIWIWCTFW